MTHNTEHARRCVGIINEKRCDYYFEFKECPTCSVKNDIASRICRECNGELIDPNAKLSLDALKNNLIEVSVLEAKYGISETQKGFRVNCAYKFQDNQGRIGSVFEHYSPISQKAMNVFYGQFVRKHCPDASKWYLHLHNRNKVEEMLQTVDTPQALVISKEHDVTKIKKKIFQFN